MFVLYLIKQVRVELLSLSLDPPLSSNFTCETRDLTSAVCKWEEERSSNLYGKRKTQYFVNNRYHISSHTPNNQNNQTLSIPDIKAISHTGPEQRWQ